MATIDHATITDPDIHEPKGASTAANGTVYVSNGAGSGSWSDNTSGIKNKNKILLNVRIPNLSSAGSSFVVCPLAGTIGLVYVVPWGTITVADDTVTGKLAGTPIGGLSVLVDHTATGPGIVASSTATSANTVTAGQAIEIVNAGTSTTAVEASVTIVVTCT